ncbi:hypothetical protein CSW30_01995 [Thermus scotoductus]|uniref:IclR-ED domain-containing protein n=1 Tax=Thermus scotoductus TaxID=37636 RepID=A0A430UT91_THESC|nr:IclR family transcriptional regulator C-terminal domain-containing protein [Thermus scotoductus]RTI11800.1 hypothetical protein CSW30_01995 [Thermus scotoductus]
MAVQEGSTTLEGRSLATARAVLRVLGHLEAHPEGITVREVAAFLGKSHYTAYYLLNTLCQEGFAWKGPDRKYYPVPRTAALERVSLGDLVAAAVEVNRVTRCRAYLVVMEEAEPVVAHVAGHRGQLGVDLFGAILHVSHATAVGKAILAELTPEARERLLASLVLTPRTPNTVTDGDRLRLEIALTQKRGVAYDKEEYQEGIYCLAVPFTLQGPNWGEPLVASLGIVVSPYRFFAERERLEEHLFRIRAQLLGQERG